MKNKTWSIQQKNDRWYVVFTHSPRADDCPNTEELFAAAGALGMPEKNRISTREAEARLKAITSDDLPDTSFLLDLDDTFEARVIVSDDNMQAHLYVRKAASQEQTLNVKLILGLLQRQTLHDVPVPEIQKALVKFAKSPQRELYTLVSEGSFPTRGNDRRLIPHTTPLDETQKQHVYKKIHAYFSTPRSDPNPLKDTDFPLTLTDTMTVVQKGAVLYEFTQPEHGKNGCDVYGTVLEGLAGNDPFILDLRNIKQTEETLIADTSGVLIQTEAERGMMLRIIPYKNASVQVQISEDNMSAHLLLHKHIGAGTPLSVDAIHAALHHANIRGSYTDEHIKAAIHQAEKSSHIIEYPLVQGTPAVAPNSYTLNWHIPLSSETHTATVKQYALIVSAVCFPNGQDGTDVYGQPVSKTAVMPVSLPRFDDTVNTTLTDLTTEYFANVSGEISYINNALTISGLKTIHQDISRSDSTIYFPGNLVIEGNIGSRCTVKADGDLAITGEALDALLQASGSVTLHGGMKGRGRGTIWAKKEISADYIENARMFASNNITVKEHSFRCTVKTNGLFQMPDEDSTFAGGNAHAAKGISVCNLGTKKTIRTLISFGQDYLIKDKIESYEREIAKNTQELARIDAALKQPLKQSVQQLHERKIALIKRNSSISWKIFNLKEYFETHIASEIRVNGTVFPGVILESHGRYYEIHETRSHVVFTFDEINGQIVCETLRTAQ